MDDNGSLTFVALVGSSRRDQSTFAIVSTLDELAPDNIQVSILPPVSELPYYDEDNRDVVFSADAIAMSSAIANSDAVVIVTPEYNNSIPGGLKNVLDWLSRLPDRPLAGKPVAIQTVSHETVGGLRAQDHLRQILLSIDARVLNKPETIITLVDEKVDSQTGAVRDVETRRSIAAQLTSLAKLVMDRRPIAAASVDPQLSLATAEVTLAPGSQKKLGPNARTAA
jgi:chromate reductase